jgi:hypothetical protein
MEKLVLHDLAYTQGEKEVCAVCACSDNTIRQKRQTPPAELCRVSSLRQSVAGDIYFLIGI